MKQANYIPFDIESLDRDTMFLTEDEFAVYMRLIIQYYKNGGPLPNDLVKLAKLTRTNTRKFKRVWPAIKDLFREYNATITHLKCDYTLSNIKLKSETNRANVLKRHNTDVTTVLPKDKDKDKDKEKEKKVTREALLKFIEDNNLDSKLIEDELVKFNDYCKASGRSYKDAMAGFRNWCRNDKFGNGLDKFRKKPTQVVSAEMQKLKQMMKDGEI